MINNERTVRIDTVRTVRWTGEVLSDWSPHLTYRCVDAEVAASVLRLHHTREAQPDGTWRSRTLPPRDDGTLLDSIEWRETATLIGPWTDAERSQVADAVIRDRHLPGGG